MEPKAGDWLQAVLDKFRRVLLPRDGSADGTYHPDGNWSIEYPYRYKFIFLDALRLATGEDWIAAHKQDLLRPLRYLKYAFMGDGNIPLRDRYDANENMLGSYQLDTYGSLFLRYASLTGDSHLQWIGTQNPTAGRTNAYGYKVKGGHRFLYPVGYSDYLWYDPRVQPQFAPPAELAKRFPDGELAILRTAWAGGLTLSCQGRRDKRHVREPGPRRELQGPLDVLLRAGGGQSAVGRGERAGGRRRDGAQRRHPSARFGRRAATVADGRLSDPQTVVVAAGRPGVVEITVARRPRSRREAALLTEEGRQYLRLRGEGYMQYDRNRNFNPDQGCWRWNSGWPGSLRGATGIRPCCSPSVSI